MFAALGGLSETLVTVIIVIAVVVVFAIFIRAMGDKIPSWLTQIIWVILAAVIAIVAIRFLLGL